jgi:hypothetical protein
MGRERGVRIENLIDDRDTGRFLGALAAAENAKWQILDWKIPQRAIRGGYKAPAFRIVSFVRKRLHVVAPAKISVLLMPVSDWTNCASNACRSAVARTVLSLIEPNHMVRKASGIENSAGLS